MLISSSCTLAVRLADLPGPTLGSFALVPYVRTIITGTPTAMTFCESHINYGSTSVAAAVSGYSTAGADNSWCFVAPTKMGTNTASACGLAAAGNLLPSIRYTPSANGNAGNNLVATVAITNAGAACGDGQTYYITRTNAGVTTTL